MASLRFSFGRRPGHAVCKTARFSKRNIKARLLYLTVNQETTTILNL
jgi:hypothetical protein